MMIKPLLHHYPLDAKSQICIGIAKIEKLKTWPLSKFILDQGYVLGNANFDPGKQICDFASSQSFFLRLKMTIVFSKLTTRTPIKNHSWDIHEEEWHQCDLRKKLCAYGGIGSPFLSKTDLFCVLPENIQITLLIWSRAVSTHFRS